MISSGKFIVGYLTVEFSASGLLSRSKNNKARQIFLRAVHEAVEHILEPLYKAAYRGIQLQKKDYLSLRDQLMLESYVSDISEAEDMQSIKRNITLNHPCIRCIVYN